MQIIINISEKDYRSMKDGHVSFNMLDVIMNGVPLDKIRAEIEEKFGDYDICEWFEDYDYEENNISEYRSVGDVSDILAIIDKYKAEKNEE